MPVPVDLSKLSDVVKSDVKKTVYDKLAAKVNSIDTRDYDTKITETENKLTVHNHDKYITTLEFNTLAADVLMQDY